MITDSTLRFAPARCSVRTPSFLPVLLLGCACLGFAGQGGARGAGADEPIQLRSGWQLQDAAKLSQSGEAISRTEFQPAGWRPATVPGTVLTSLVSDGVYPEPLYGENNRPDKIPESLARTTYWYRTVFEPPAAFAGKRVWLTFHGINYIADIWVNGHQVGRILGAFARGIFDVTSLVTVGQPNALAVHVQPQPHAGATHEKTMATGTGPNGGVTALDGPTFLCSIGWDWIPTIRDRNTGIWQEVTLSASGPVVVEDPAVTSELSLPSADTAELTVEATVRNATDTAQSGTLSGTVEEAKFQQEVSLAPHEARVVTFQAAATPVLRLRQPRLWWPNGFGPQNLYTLHLSFSVGGSLSHSIQTTFGVRKITYSLPGSDNLALSVNGVPVMVKGGDWGMDEAMKRIPRGRLEAEIRMHQLANYTLIRNWVGQSTSEDLYDLCDQYGILLWDEFFQPHPADGPVPEDTKLYLANVREKILRFRNHPSIALWCARNEGDPPPAIGQGIQKLITALDPRRLYQPSSTSGRGVNSGGPYFWRTPREFYTYGEAFKTEVGSVSVPTLEAVKGMMPRKDWEVINDDWAEHDFCAGAQAGDRYPDIISSRYGVPLNLADFVRKSQLANYEAFRAMYEGRFAKLFRPETGVVTWMSSPAQPSFVWQLYSYDLEPNSSLFATRKACEPVHIQMNENDWHVMVINHTPKPLSGLVVQAKVYNLDGSLILTHRRTIAAAPSAATDADAIAFPNQGLSAVHLIKLELRDARNQLIGDNFYWRANPAHPDDLQALNSLPTVSLAVQAKRQSKDGKCLLEVAVTNPSRAPALMAHLQLRRDHSGQRVLPVYYSDNYLCLLPGEVKTLTVEAAAADLGGESPLLAVDGWNVTAKAAPASSQAAAVAPNRDAIVPSGAVVPAVKEAPGTAKINCGGGATGFFRGFGVPVPGPFGEDHDFTGGSIASSDRNPVDAGAADAAPGAVYQTERWGACTYALAATKNTAYLVRLHFVEFRSGVGERKFNVEINGRQVLADFDIAAEAGKGKALVKVFPSVTPNADGKIVIAFLKGAAGEPKICGIELVPR